MKLEIYHNPDSSRTHAAVASLRPRSAKPRE